MNRNRNIKQYFTLPVNPFRALIHCRNFAYNQLENNGNNVVLFPVCFGNNKTRIRTWLAARSAESS